MAKRAIKMPVDTRERMTPIIEKVVSKGQMHGYVTEQEILQAIPEPEKNIALLDQLYDVFFDKGKTWWSRSYVRARHFLFCLIPNNLPH